MELPWVLPLAAPVAASPAAQRCASCKKSICDFARLALKATQKKNSPHRCRPEPRRVRSLATPLPFTAARPAKNGGLHPAAHAAA